MGLTLFFESSSEKKKMGFASVYSSRGLAKLSLVELLGIAFLDASTLSHLPTSADGSSLVIISILVQISC